VKDALVLPIAIKRSLFGRVLLASARREQRTQCVAFEVFEESLEGVRGACPFEAIEWRIDRPRLEESQVVASPRVVDG
jgi:hypothetical protein